MTNHKWLYVAKGHYSTSDGGWTVHVLSDGAVYKTHPSRATVDITGSSADRYIESAQTKFPVRGEKRAEPEPKQETSARVAEKQPKKPKKRVTKKQVSAAAKKLAKGAGAIIGTTRAFVTEVGEAEERTYAERKTSPPKKKGKPKREAPPPKKKGKPKRKTSPPKKKGKPKREAPLPKKTGKRTARRAVPPPATEHPLEYLISGEGALLHSRRKAAPKGRREPTLEEYLGF